MSIKINNQDIVAIYKGEQIITYVYKGTDLVWYLKLHPLDKYIYFVDPEVGRVLYANGLIADPIRATKRELVAIKSLNPSNTLEGGYFYHNKFITQFPELKYCTGLTRLDFAFSTCPSLTEVILPSSVTNLRGTFYGCSGLLEAPVIPEGVTNLFETFKYCSRLTTAPIIPEGVTNLSGTFRGTRLTTSPIIPEGVTNLFETFGYCSRLTTAPIIPSSVTNMDSTFFNCSSLFEAPIIPSSVTNMDFTFWTCSSIDGIYVINRVTPPTCYNTFDYTNVQAIYVPEASVSAYKRASGWRNYADKIYPMSEGPFEVSGKFADPEVGRVLHANGLIASPTHSTYEELATITSLNPNNSDTGSYFYGNEDITRFPELKYFTGLTSLYGAFFNCLNLTTVGGIIPEGVTDLRNTFSWCTRLTRTPIIPEGVTDLSETFRNCYDLTTAPVIPEGVTNLYYTFFACTKLTKAPVIPNSVTDLRNTFQANTLIDGYYVINAVTPPIYSDSLSRVQAIYVPNASVDAYKSASGWSDFADKIYSM